ncbi:MAG TPA: vitamin K epoxide reductase family protein [Kofleriaceae bacterium]|nr:vitamin K epoxide reductase family protein [Kofleriaceae bacterium]
MRPPAWLVVVLVGALAGLVFAGVSTYDFVQHLDRQVHSLHCSFIPGAGAETGASGCQAAMMSPYSSVFRTAVWGGIPISLPAMAVFAFLLFYGLELLVSRRTKDPRATAFLALAACLPALASVTMLTISLVKLGTTCKLCVGVYLASAMCLTGAIVLWRGAVRARAGADGGAALPRAVLVKGAEVGHSSDGASLLEVQVEGPTVGNKYLGGMFGLGVAFVVVPVLVYLAMAPDHGKFIGSCGELSQPADTYGVMVPLQRGGRTPALEILDPLCPACRAFEQRLAASDLGDQLDRKAILFPLDTTCNWMITENTHPGACTVSEAVLCAGERAHEVIAWAFDVQERIRTETKADPAAAARIVKERFPELAACVGSPVAKSRLNKSLRWAVANNIRVLTPQLFVDNVKLCDEDVDLGLDYALSRMIKGEMPARTAKPVEPTAAGSAAPMDPHAAAPVASDKPAAATTAPAATGKPATTPSTGATTDNAAATPSGASEPPATGTPGPTPTTSTPTTSTPTTGEPATGAPANGAPKAPSSDHPATAPVTDKPASDTPASTDKPVTSPSASDKPATDSPATETGATP